MSSHPGRCFGRFQSRGNRRVCGSRALSDDESPQLLELLRLSRSNELALESFHDLIEQCDRPLPIVELLGRQTVLPPPSVAG